MTTHRDVFQEDRLPALIHAVARTPESWRGWVCLTLRPEDGTPEDKGREFLDAAAALLSSYLGDFEHRIFLHAGREVYAFFRAVPRKILDEARAQVASIAELETGAPPEDAAYELETAAQALEEHFREKGGDVLALPARKRPQRPEFPDSGPGEHSANRNPETAPVRVLLVDDDPVARWMVRNALRRECRFVAASNARSACAMIPSYRPDVVFLDIDLPDRDGRSVLEWIVADDPGACVVMFSGNGDLDSVAGALESGAKGFIAKPFLRENLLRYVRREA